MRSPTTGRSSRDWMVPITAGSKRKPVTVDEDWGVRPIVLEELTALAPFKRAAS